MTTTITEKEEDAQMQLAMLDLKRRLEDQERQNRLLSLKIDVLLPELADISLREGDGARQRPHASMRQAAMLDLQRTMQDQKQQHQFLTMQMDFILRGNVCDVAQQQQIKDLLVHDCARQVHDPPPQVALRPADPIQWQADYAKMEQALSELERKLERQGSKLRSLLRKRGHVCYFALQHTEDIWRSDSYFAGQSGTEDGWWKDCYCKGQFLLGPAARKFWKRFINFRSCTLDYLLFFYKWYGAETQSGFALTKLKLDNWDECEAPHVVADFLSSQATVFQIKTLSVGTPTPGIVDCVTTALAQCGSRPSSLQHLEITTCDPDHGRGGTRSLLLAKQDWLSISIDWVTYFDYVPEYAQMISDIAAGVAGQTRMEKFSFNLEWREAEELSGIADLVHTLCCKLQKLRVLNLCCPLRRGQFMDEEMERRQPAAVNALFALLESRENQLEELRWDVDIDWFFLPDLRDLKKRLVMAVARNQSLRSLSLWILQRGEIEAFLLRNRCIHKVRTLMRMGGSVSLLEWVQVVGEVATSSYRSFPGVTENARRTTASASALYLALANSTSLKLHLWTTFSLKRECGQA